MYKLIDHTICYLLKKRFWCTIRNQLLHIPLSCDAVEKSITIRSMHNQPITRSPSFVCARSVHNWLTTQSPPLKVHDESTTKRSLSHHLLIRQDQCTTNLSLNHPPPPDNAWSTSNQPITENQANSGFTVCHERINHYPPPPRFADIFSRCMQTRDRGFPWALQTWISAFERVGGVHQHSSCYLVAVTSFCERGGGGRQISPLLKKRVLHFEIETDESYFHFFTLFWVL